MDQERKITKEMKEIIELVKTGNNELLKANLRDNPSLASSKKEQRTSPLLFTAYCRNREAIEITRTHLSKLDIFGAVSIGNNNTVLHLIERYPDQTKPHRRFVFIFE